MRILWLHSHLLYSNGGTRFIFEVASRLNKYHEVTIFVEKAENDWVRNFRNSKITVRTLSSYTSVNAIYWLVFPLFLLKEKLQLQQFTKNYDLIISSMFPFNYLATQYSKRTLYYCFEPFAFFYDRVFISNLPFYKRWGSKFLSRVYQELDKKGVSHANKILTINKTVAKWVEQVYRKKPSNITYLGVDTNFFYKHKSSKPNLWKNNQILFHTTDFTILKGTEYLIQALAFVVKKYPQVKLIITNVIEDRERKSQYEKLIHSLGLESYIDFIGTIPYASLPKYYSFSDVVCFCGDPSSIGTTASLSVLEAMSCEASIVRSIGCDEEIVDGDSGLLVDPRNTEKFASKIIQLLNNKKLGKKLGKKARERILKYYLWNKVTSIFLKEIEELRKP